MSDTAWFLLATIVPLGIGAVLGWWQGVLAVWGIWSLVMGATVALDHSAWGNDFFPVALIAGYIYYGLIAFVGAAAARAFAR